MADTAHIHPRSRAARAHQQAVQGRRNQRERDIKSSARAGKHDRRAGHIAVELAKRDQRAVK